MLQVINLASVALLFYIAAQVLAWAALVGVCVFVIFSAIHTYTAPYLSTALDRLRRRLP